MSSEALSSNQDKQPIKYNNVSWKKLKENLPYDLITNYVVSHSEMCIKWPRMLNTLSTKPKTKLRNELLYNVVCQHSDCKPISSWKKRYNLLQFKSSHWATKHTKDVNVKAKIVSFWSTNAQQTVRENEYRLVDIQTLKYISPVSTNANCENNNYSDDETDYDNNTNTNNNTSHERHPALYIYIPKVNLRCTQQCDILFNTSADFKTHMQSNHSMTRPYKCLYNNCIKDYKNKNALIDHIRIRHIKQGNHQCSLCHAVFTEKFKYNRHIAVCDGDKGAKIHPSLYIYVAKVNLKCEQCDILFNSAADFKTHMKSKHSISKPYKCLYDNCIKEYKVKKEIIEHVRVKHIKQCKYKCNVCHMLFQQPSKYKRHVSSCGVDKGPKVHPSLYVYVKKVNLKCEQCNQLFNTCKSFKNHMKDKHSNTAPYKCLYDKCNMCYSRRSVLIGHIRVKHIKQAKYECDVCRKLFYVKQNWREHTAIHKTERPWKCTKCPMGFKTKHVLRSHVKNIHIEWNQTKSNQSTSNMDVPMLEPTV